MSALLLSALAFLLWGASASAQTSDQRRRCAHLGEGFVPVEGSNGCVRIGDHVRVDIPDARAFDMTPLTHDGPQPATERLEVRPRIGSRQGGLLSR
jgi:hypothetical protein